MEAISSGGIHSMHRHAYLIIAHNQWKILRKQIELLDSEHSDFFVHIDKKTIGFPNDIKSWTKRSQIFLFQHFDVHWADYSQIQCELFLLKQAADSENYSFYHLLSGVDLPLKTVDSIYSFFESNQNKNFIGIVPKEVFYSVRRVKYYHFFTKLNCYRNSKILKALDRLSEDIQRVLFVNRLKKRSIKIIDGWQWFSINQEFAMFIICEQPEIEKIFMKSIAADELVFQTMIYNSPFRKTLYDETDLKNGSMRYIDWERGRPYTWGQNETDYELLMNSPYMFARKFDEKHIDIVNMIYDELSRRNAE